MVILGTEAFKLINRVGRELSTIDITGVALSKDISLTFCSSLPFKLISFAPALSPIVKTFAKLYPPTGIGAILLISLSK